MALRVATNISSINTQRSLDQSQRKMDRAYAQLSSGSRITKAADDAAGLTISENLKSRVRSFTQAQRNANDAMSVIQVAEGGLNEIGNILIRLRELGVQASSDNIGDRERGFIDTEVQQLKAEMDRIANTTKFGETSLLNGEGTNFEFQIDIGNDPTNDVIGFDASDIEATTAVLNVDGFDFSSRDGARESLDVVEAAQTKVNEYRSNLGALQSRLNSTSDNLGVTIGNLSAANSRIRDTDVASATAELTQNNILLNASLGVLSQANQAPGVALKLIG